MILRITRIPAGFGRVQIISLLGGRSAKIKTHKIVGGLAVLEIPSGNTKDVIALLDHGFTLEVIQW